MRVLVISAAYPPMQAGEATNTYHLCRHLAARDVDIHVLTSRANGSSADPRIRIHPIMHKWNWHEMFRLRSFLRECAPDAVFLMYIGVMYHCHPMITFVPTLVKRMFPNVPCVTRYESVFVGANPSNTSIAARAFRRAVVRWAGEKDVAYSSGTLLRDSDRIIALCERHRSLIIEEWPLVKQKVEMIPPPPNLLILDNENNGVRQRGRSKLGLRDEHFVIAFFGYLYRTKGIEFLLQAFSSVRQKRSNVKLLFIGGKVGLDVEGSSDYFQHMQSLAKELGLEADVLWTGPVKSDQEEGSMYLYAADVAVLPFLQGVQLNNSSLASIAAHGLPIVATRGPLMDQAFVHERNILLSEPKDAQAIANHILRLMDDPSLMGTLKAGVRQLSNEWFSWDKAIDKTMATFQLTRACLPN